MVLVQDTGYILLDEPLDNLDVNYVVQAMQILKRLVDELGKTILAALYGVSFAVGYTDEVAAMKSGKLYAHDVTKEAIQISISNDLHEMNIQICGTGGRRFHPYH